MITREEPRERIIMAAGHRLHRDDPERTGPIRNWSALYRSADSWSQDASTVKATEEDRKNQYGVPPDAVSRGVTLGYQVIEEHLQQGRRIAQLINKRLLIISRGRATTSQFFLTINARFCEYRDPLV